MAKLGIGQPVPRVEDRRFLTGLGRYVADLTLPRQCYGALVLSPHAHADVRGIDTSEAKRYPGVICVLTGADAVSDRLGSFPPLYLGDDRGNITGYRTLRPVLAIDRVRFVGERVAFVVAETEDQARDAAEQVLIDYEPLPAVVDVEDAIREGAPALWSDCADNVTVRIQYGDPAKTEAEFAKAAHVISMRLVNNRVSANPMEPRAAIGDYNAGDDTYTLYATSQAPHSARQILAREIFCMPENRLRVVSPDVGGGFGVKIHPYPEDALVLWASRRCGRPVKWVATRSESLLTDNHGRDQVAYGEMALDREGRILAIRARALHAVGGYIFHGGVTPVINSMRLIPNAYDVTTIDVSTRAIFTNTSTLSAYRGAGRPEAIYVVERLVDRAAQAVGLDPVEIRRRNFIPPTKLPFTTPTGYTYDSGEFERTMDACVKLADWDGFAGRRAAAETQGLLRGRGLAYYIESGGRYNDRMEIRFDPSGAVTVLAGTHSHGQGHETTYAQLLVEFLGVPFESVRFVQGDTGQVSYGRGTYAARSSMVGSDALRLAAIQIVEKARPLAAHLLEAAIGDVEFGKGVFRVSGTDRIIALPEVAKAMYRAFGNPDQFGAGLEASATSRTAEFNHPNGCHICEVLVDPETGVVKLDRYAVVDDFGVVINPTICEGQVHGGLAQGIGQALLEHIVYEKEFGQLLSGSFIDYGIPRADDMPAIAVAFEEIPSKSNALGIKGAGEAGAVPSPATIMNAIEDALRPLGVTDLQMPATPFRVWQAIQDAKRG